MNRPLSSYYRRTVTTSYSTLAVSSAAWEEVASRLKEAGVADEYIDNNKIIFGTVALVKEHVNITWERENRDILNKKE